MNKLEDFLGKGIDPLIIIELIVLNMSWMVVLAVPMGVLFSTLMAYGGLSATYEIPVIKASGASLIRMMTPVVIAGFGLSLFMLWYNDVVLPETNHMAKTLMNDIQRTKPSLLIEKGRFVQELDGYTILSRDIDSISGTMYGVTIYQTRDLKNRSVVNADSGRVSFSEDYSRLVLDLYSGEIHQSELNNVNSYRKMAFDEYQVVSRQSGFGFEETDGDIVSRGERELSISDMQEIVDENKERVASTDSTIKAYFDSYIEGFSLVDTTQKVEIRNEDAWNNDSLAVKNNAISMTGDNNTISNASELTNSQDSIKSKFLNQRSINPLSKNKEIKDLDTTQIVNREKNTDTIKSTFYQDNAKIISQELSTLRSNIWSKVSQKRRYEKNIRKYEVEIYKKYSIPFACLVFVLIGCPLGVKTKGGNFGTSAAISLGFYVLFWACLIGGEKLADEGYISPALGMWMGDIIVGTLGIFLILKTNNENFTFFKR
ncbi:MAG: hypothetical protein Kapaf2KO_02360 [Candidatus Kapaibacteriales bacterium]